MTTAMVGFAGFMLRAQVADHAAWFNLLDWGWNLGRISLVLSMLARPLVGCARRRTRFFAIFADVRVTLWLLFAFAST